MREPLTLIDRERGVCCAIDAPVPPGTAESAADLLRAIADPTRLSMLACLRRARQAVCICDFTAAFNLSQPTISHHMGKLRNAGLVTAEKRGIWTFYTALEPLPPVVEAALAALAP
jgi:ArsR family transcriptional regulator